MEKADTNDCNDMVFLGEFAVHVNTKIENNIDRLDDVWSNIEIEIEICDVLQISLGSKPDQLSPCQIQLKPSRIASGLDGFDAVLEPRSNTWNIVDSQVCHQLHIISIHVVAQEVFLDKLCQILSVGNEPLESQQGMLVSTSQGLDCCSLTW